MFIRERMFRVARKIPLAVVSPVPWFPMQGLIRRFRPHFRPAAPAHEIDGGIEVFRPRFFSVPGALKWLDGWLMALGCLRLVRRLKRSSGYNIIDAHFAYPDGYAAALLGRWLALPVTITLRGTEVPIARDRSRRKRMLRALKSAARVFSVAAALRDHVVGLGAEHRKITLVGNGVDTAKFHPMPRAAARHELALPPDARILISVGGLVERKGFHRVIECLPALLKRFPGLHYLIVGGPSPEGDFSEMLRGQVEQLNLKQHVHFLGAMSSERLKVPLSAADIFVLATRNEGWANVFLEAMACGLPVVTTDVGGNCEVVCESSLGTTAPFGDSRALQYAMEDALEKDWDREAIISYARENSWDRRVDVLVDEFTRLAAKTRSRYE